MLTIAFALSKAAVKNEKRSGPPYLMFCMILKEKYFFLLELKKHTTSFKASGINLIFRLILHLQYYKKSSHQF